MISLVVSRILKVAPRHPLVNLNYVFLGIQTRLARVDYWETFQDNFNSYHQGNISYRKEFVYVTLLLR